MDTKYDIKRFVEAQEGVYPSALSEIQNGHKSSHWMWYIFPQLKGLGRTWMANHYGIADIEEARAYLADPILGPRLTEITRAFYQLEGDPLDILGSPDHLKMKSCMTLFDAVMPGSIFNDVLEKFYHGKRCGFTLAHLQQAQ